MDRNFAMQNTKQLALLYDRLFLCPSCSLWRLPRKSKPTRLRSTKRNASTYSSATAINATKPIPPRLKPLYDAMLDVRKAASSHINTSRLQLALQGLESKNPTIRLAVLGLNVPDTARRIVRLLLADPLEDEGEWEKQLADGHQDYSRGVIIRYRRDGGSGVSQPRNSVPVLYIPAGVLERHNLEILVSSVNGPSNDGPLQTASTPADTFLSPAVGTPTSFEGRQTVISQPVHKTLLIAQGLDQVIAVAQLLASTNFNSVEDRDSIRVAVNLQDIQIPQTKSSGTDIVNTQSAEDGLAAIRSSVKQATEYEHKWMASGMIGLSEWMVFGAGAETSQNKHIAQPIQSLIKSVLEAAAANIEAARLSTYQSAAEHSLTTAQTLSLETALDSFSRSAHQELQSGLASAWSSRNWRKLAWYKLFWRVDDVGLIVTDLVNSAWLPRTERAVYELSGRLEQVGIYPVALPDPDVEGQPIAQSSVQQETSDATILQPAVVGQTSQLAIPSISGSNTAFAPTAQELTPTIPIITNPSGSQAQIEMTTQQTTTPAPVLLTTKISDSRRGYISTSTTELTSTAQQLVFRTLSLTGLSGGLSALTYASNLSTSIYEASTILAVGGVYALWTMQTGWLKATKRFERGLYTAGREIVVDINDNILALIRRKSQVHVDPVQNALLDRADRAVEKARSELDRLGRDS